MERSDVLDAMGKLKLYGSGGPTAIGPRAARNGLLRRDHHDGPQTPARAAADHPLPGRRMAKPCCREREIF